MGKIKFVYFDIGGVLVKDFSETQEWNEMTTRWGIPEERKDEVNIKFDKFEEGICEGKGSVEDFKNILKSDFGIDLPADYLINENFANRFYRNDSIVKIAENCAKICGVGLLTNMYPGMLDLIKERKLIPEIDWTVVVDSSKEGCRKPLKEIFLKAQEKSGVLGEEILFVDNIERNLIIPREMGWKTFFYSSANYEESSRKLEKYLEETEKIR